MEIAEAVKLLDTALTKDKYCDGNKSNSKGWKVVIDGIKGGEGNAATLRSTMLGASMGEPDATHLHSVAKCGPSSFPYQSHHLIPEKQLPAHKVCVWLTDSPKKKDPKYTLEKDTNYDTNGAKNGYFMPFASTTIEWAAAKSAAKKALVCFEMMRRTKIQLHQGPHSRADYAEEAGIETKGYKTMVEEFLDTLADRAASHVEVCKNPCQSKKVKGKIPVQPLEAMVKQMNLVSELLQALVDSQRIFVSKRAAAYFLKFKNKNNAINHPAKPLI